MDERPYCLCRLLGSPIVYQLVVLLEASGKMTLTRLAKLSGRHVSITKIALCLMAYTRARITSTRGDLS